MKYYLEATLKDGRKCVIRNGEASDGSAALENYLLTHSQSDYLTTYPEECRRDLSFQQQRLADKIAGNDVELLAIVDNKVVGTAGIDVIRNRIKTKHRCTYGVSVDKEYWGLGIGSLFLQCCIECAQKAGYKQIELEVVEENTRAVNLYKKYGFVVIGRNERGMIGKDGNYQVLLNMVLPLGD